MDYDHYVRALDRFGIDRRSIEAIMRAGFAERLHFEDEARVEALAGPLEAIGHHVVGTERDDEHGLWELVVRSSLRGQREFRVNLELVQTVEYRQLRRLRGEIAKLDQTPIRVVQGKEERELESKEALLDHLLETGRRGLAVQRYKGLGEMNPEQLWETTMDPGRRSVLQVRIEDAAEADMLFSVLMGDAVEPRREFIERFALEVENLDV
jgi:DNA gyrase subunit B